MEDQRRNFNPSTSFSKYDDFADCHSRSDYYDKYEEYEEDELDDYICPFCYVDFNILELYCHILEDHPIEAEMSVCPMCVKDVGKHLVDHIAEEHERDIYRRPNEFRDKRVIDQLLASFLCSYHTPAEDESKPVNSSSNACVEEELPEVAVLESNIEKCSLSEEKQEEHLQRCKFVKDLLFSTVLDNDL